MLRTRINYNQLVTATWIIFLIAFLLDMGGGFKIKDLALVGIVILLFVLLLKNKLKFPFENLALDLIVFIFTPFIIVAYSIIYLNIPISDVIGQSSAFITVFILFLLVQLKSKETLVKTVNFVFRLLPIISILTFLLILVCHYIGLDVLIQKMNQLANQYNLGYVGENPLGVQIGVFLPNVYFKWSILLIPITIFFYIKNKKWFLLSAIATFMTLSTGIIIFTVLGVVILSALKFKLHKIFSFKFIIFCIVFFVMTVILLRFGLIEIILSKFNSESTSTSAKLGHIKSILEEISRNSQIFLLGMGVGATFFSEGINGFAINVEVSHFNLMRQYGMIYFCLFILYVLITTINLSKIDLLGKGMAVGLIMLFICAGTNPLLISPIFFIWVFVCRGYIILPREVLSNG